MQFSTLLSVYVKENPLHLKACLDSIVNQSRQPDEIIIVCDGSLTDELYQVLNEFKARYANLVAIHTIEKNVGLGSALNFGLSKCRYSIVARMDTDDICHPERFEKQLEYLKEHKDIRLVGSFIKEFSGSIDNVVALKSLPTTNADLKHFAKFRNPLNHMTVMFYKEDVLRVGSYQPLFYLEDYYLWVRMIHAGIKMANIPEALVFARVDNGMIERRSNKRYIHSWFILNQYMEKNKMITKKIFFRNMLSVTAFVFSPLWFKRLVYRYILRRGKGES